MTVPLRPLECSGCGAAVPFGAEPVARCAYCSTEVVAPAEYQAVRQVAQRFLDDRGTAQALYADLGRPPGWLLQRIGRQAEASARVGGGVGVGLLGLVWANPVLGIGAVLALAFVMGVPAAALLRASYWIGGAPVPEPLSPYLVVSLGAVITTFGFGIPALWFGLERELAPIRCDVHASLAAALPQRPGGPALCWKCGAALDIPSGALGVPCAYCRTDNLVALPTDWVQRLRSVEHRHFQSIDAALTAYREARAAAHQRLWKLLFGLVLLFPVVMLAAYFLDVLRVSF